jgi:hypothetical protein
VCDSAVAGKCIIGSIGCFQLPIGFNFLSGFRVYHTLKRLPA